MTSTTAWPAVVRALRALLGARPGYRLPGATAAVGATTVYLGSQPLGTADPGDWVLLAPALDDGDVAGTWSQSWAGTVPTVRPRDEDGTVDVLVSATSGSPDPLDTLARAFAALAGLELVVAGRPDLGLVPGTFASLVARPPISGSVSWVDTERGGRCLLSASISYRARLQGLT